MNIAKGPMKKYNTVDDVSIDWQRVYDLLRLREVRIHDETFVNPYLWVIPVACGVTIRGILDTFDRIDIKIDGPDTDYVLCNYTHDRNPSVTKGHIYKVCFRKSVDPDVELKNMSPSYLWTHRIAGITLIEYMLLHLGYLITTDKHLGKKTPTACIGSRRKHRNAEVSSPMIDCWDQHPRISEVDGGQCLDGGCTRAVVTKENQQRIKRIIKTVDPRYQSWLDQQARYVRGVDD